MLRLRPYPVFTFFHKNDGEFYCFFRKRKSVWLGHQFPSSRRSHESTISHWHFNRHSHTSCRPHQELAGDVYRRVHLRTRNSFVFCVCLQKPHKKLAGYPHPRRARRPTVTRRHGTASAWRGKVGRGVPIARSPRLGEARRGGSMPAGRMQSRDGARRRQRFGVLCFFKRHSKSFTVISIKRRKKKKVNAPSKSPHILHHLI